MAKSKKTSTKKKDAQTMLDAMLEELGDGAQLLGSDGIAIKIRGVISTQVPGIDKAIGRGGIPLGRLTIVRGPEGSGKTTLALHLVAECQRQGGIVLYMDMEYKLDPDYAAAIGVDTSKLVIKQPNHLEEVYSSINRVIKSVAKAREKHGVRVPILVVLDSTDASISKAEYEGEFEDKHMATKARVHSQALPKLIPLLHKEDVALLFIAQIRGKIGQMFGPQEEMSGGRALRFYASLIMEVRPFGFLKEDGDKKASKVAVTCVKNQISPPFKKAECIINYGEGFDKDRSLLSTALELGIIELKGSYYKYNGKSLAQGEQNMVNELADDPVLRKRLMKGTKGKLGW